MTPDPALRGLLLDAVPCARAGKLLGVVVDLISHSRDEHWGRPTIALPLASLACAADLTVAQCRRALSELVRAGWLGEGRRGYAGGGQSRAIYLSRIGLRRVEGLQSLALTKQKIEPRHEKSSLAQACTSIRGEEETSLVNGMNGKRRRAARAASVIGGTSRKRTAAEVMSGLLSRNTVEDHAARGARSVKDVEMLWNALLARHFPDEVRSRGLLSRKAAGQARFLLGEVGADLAPALVACVGRWREFVARVREQEAAGEPRVPSLGYLAQHVGALRAHWRRLGVPLAAEGSGALARRSGRWVKEDA